MSKPRFRPGLFSTYEQDLKKWRQTRDAENNMNAEKAVDEAINIDAKAKAEAERIRRHVIFVDEMEVLTPEHLAKIYKRVLHGRNFGMSADRLRAQAEVYMNAPIPDWAKSGFVKNATQSKLYNERVVENSKSEQGAIDVEYVVVVEGLVKYQPIPWYIRVLCGLR